MRQRYVVTEEHMLVLMAGKIIHGIKQAGTIIRFLY
jgi:hypothetical protein